MALKQIHIRDKIYSIHEPDATSIKRGKAVKDREYGCKVNITTSPKGYIVSSEIYHENIADIEMLPNE